LIDRPAKLREGRGLVLDPDAAHRQVRIAEGLQLLGECDNRVFLAAPADRLDGFLELLRPILPSLPAQAPRANVGKARLEKAPPSRESLDKIREMVAEDQLLFDYVSKDFDEVYRRHAAPASVA